MAILNPFRIGQGVLGQQLGPYPYGVLNAGQVPYWQGNEFKIPGFTPQPWVYMPPAQQSSSAPTDPQNNPNAGILAAMMQGGDGGAGNGFGDREPSVAPDAMIGAQQEQGVPAGYGVGIAEPVGVPSAPSAPTAPAQGLAVAEVDPQGTPGKSSTSKSAHATPSAAQAATVAAVDQAIAADQAALGKAATNMTDAVAAAMSATAPSVGVATGVNMNDVDETGATGTDLGKETQDSMNAMADMSTNANQGLMGFFSGLNDVIGGMGGSSTAGGPGTSGGSATSGTGPNAGDEGGLGAWRKGGFVGDDGDKKLEPVKGILHEREFVLTPEVTAAIQKKSPGLLHRLAKMQKMMAA